MPERGARRNQRQTMTAARNAQARFKANSIVNADSTTDRYGNEIMALGSTFHVCRCILREAA
jgi:hypothetical protein